MKETKILQLKFSFLNGEILMKTRIPLKLKIILILSLAGIVMNALSVFFFTCLDYVVHGDLYSYGLQFSYEWAERYWNYSRLMLGSVAITTLVTGISIAFILVRTRTRKIYSEFLSFLFLVVATVMTGSSIYFFNRLDYIVHFDLYSYGLQFSYEWAEQYWTYARLINGLLGFSSATTVISIVLIISIAGTHARSALLRIDPKKYICLILISGGLVALAFSINYASSILAFTGLGLVFWGGLLLYISPSDYVKSELLTLVLSSLTNIDRVIKEKKLEGKGIYLPPKYLKDPESSIVFIPSKRESVLPRPEEIHEENLFSKNPEGLYLTPPGLSLSQLFEKTLGTTFTRTDLEFLQKKLPKLLIEDLEIAEDLNIQTEDDIITVELAGNIFADVCQESAKLERIHESIGCPLCSAIACALAKATGRPVTIEKEEQSKGRRTNKIQYRIM